MGKIKGRKEAVNRAYRNCYIGISRRHAHDRKGRYVPGRVLEFQFQATARIARRAGNSTLDIKTEIPEAAKILRLP